MSRKPKTRFEVVAKSVNEYLKEDGVSLNFKGYRETLLSYQRLADHHIGEVYDLMIECVLWSNYMHEIRSFILWKRDEALLKEDYYLALEDRRNPSAELETQIQKWKGRAKDYKLLEKHLIAQYKFFIKASEQCRSAYNKSVKSLGLLY